MVLSSSSLEGLFPSSEGRDDTGDLGTVSVLTWDLDRWSRSPGLVLPRESALSEAAATIDASDAIGKLEDLNSGEGGKWKTGRDEIDFFNVEGGGDGEVIVPVETMAGRSEASCEGFGLCVSPNLCSGCTPILVT